MISSRTILGRLSWPRRLGALGLVALLLHWAGTASQAEPPGAGDAKTVTGKVERFTTAPKGEVDGLILDDGTRVHWPPHMQDRFKSLAERGDRIKVTGKIKTGKAGDTKLEAQVVTNLRTNHSAENDGAPPPRGGKGHKADGPPPPPPPDAQRFASSGRGDTEQRLRALEEKMDRVLREIERLRREK